MFQERSHSEVCENNNKIAPKIVRQTSEPVTLDKAAGDARTHRKMSMGNPQSDIVPSRPYLNRCTSVPTDGDSESRFSRFRSIPDRCFSRGDAPSPWSCGSSTLELSHMGGNMRAGTCSTSPDPGTYRLFPYRSLRVVTGLYHCAGALFPGFSYVLTS